MIQLVWESLYTLSYDGYITITSVTWNHMGTQDINIDY